MNVNQCNHIRIRDDNLYGINVEEFIKFIETKHNIDFRSLPQWKELVKRLHVATTDCKRRVQNANLRKLLIINKLYTQSTRYSPFELTDKLARTYDKWETINRHRKYKLCLQSEPEILPSTKSEGIENEISETSYTVHPNTEILETEFVSTEIIKSDVLSEVKSPEVLSPLPVKICLNQHKRISPLNSRDLIFESKLSSLEIKNISAINSEECLVMNSFAVQSDPKQICIMKKRPLKQILNFSIVNCTTEYMHIRYLRLDEEKPFKRFKILPPTPQKLYPGLSIPFRLVFKLQNDLESFQTALLFKIGKNVLDGKPVEVFSIPVVSKFKEQNLVSVTETVHIPPVYLWQIRQDSGFPSAPVSITVNDISAYHLHIAKRSINITDELQDSSVSVEVISVATESLIERIEDADVAAHSKMLVSNTDELQEIIITTLDVVELVLEDIIEHALDTFVFNHTYLYLTPQSRKKIHLFFTKPICIGSHHCYYDFKFYDAETDEIMIEKTLKVFAEVLPHPIQIHPPMLDMSLSPVTHGFCEDKIVITNTHKSYPVTIKIKLTTKMKKLFKENPMEMFLPALTKAEIVFRLCSMEAGSCGVEDLAYFNFKIIVIGDEAIYKNVPPFFYEVIAPCASLFKKIYNEKYFSDKVSETREN